MNLTHSRVFFLFFFFFFKLNDKYPGRRWISIRDRLWFLGERHDTMNVFSFSWELSLLFVLEDGRSIID